MLKHLAARPPPRRARRSSGAKLAHSVHAHALVGRLPSLAILGVVGGLASLSYLAELLRSMLTLPDWVFNLSIFHVYGQPIMTGVNWTGTLVMLGLALALLAFATSRFTRAGVRN